MSDVLLLADILERYRKMCWDRMGLEALAYISLPSLTFDACLKLSKKRLQIVKDIDMLQMLETGIRGSCNDLQVNFKLLQFIKIFNYTEISAKKLILTYFF